MRSDGPLDRAAPTTRDEKRARSAHRIVEAAREEFALVGSEAATIRSIARRAGVHPSLVMQHFGSKAALFSVAVQLPVHDDARADGHLHDVLRERMGSLPPQTRALMRSMLTSPEARAVMRPYLQDRIDNLAASMTGDDAEARAAVVVSSILGLTIARHFLDLESFDRVSADDVVRVSEEMLGGPAAPDELST